MNLFNCKYIRFSYFQTSLDEIIRALNKETKFLIKTQPEGERVESVFDSFNIEYPHTKGGKVFYKSLFFCCRSTDGVIMLSNLADGWQTLCLSLSGFIACDIYQFALSEYDLQDYFSLMSLIRGQKYQRVIYTMKDQKWVFFQEGEALFFENMEYYKRRKIALRLNKEILTEYCHALRLDVEKEEFWEIQGASILCERRWE